MRLLFRKPMMLIVIALSLSAVCELASASVYRCYNCGDHRGYYYRDGAAYRPVGYQYCRWVGGFWRQGIWHPAQKVCWVR